MLIFRNKTLSLKTFQLKMMKNLFAVWVTIEQISQRGSTVSLAGDVQGPCGHSPVPCAVGWPCLNREVAPMMVPSNLTLSVILWLLKKLQILKMSPVIIFHLCYTVVARGRQSS